MSKHLSKRELGDFADGKPPLKTLFEQSRHIAGCRSCAEKLRTLAPAFFEERENGFGGSNGGSAEHFSEEQIAGFFQAAYPVRRRLEMSEHFRECESCRKRMMAENPENLRGAVYDYLRKVESVAAERSVPDLGTLIPAGLLGLLLLSMFVYLAVMVFVPHETAMRAAVETEAVPIVPPTANTETDPPNKRHDAANTMQTPPRPLPAARTTRERTGNARRVPAEAVRPTAETNSGGMRTATNRSAADSGCVDGEEVVLVAPYLERVGTRPLFRWLKVKDAVRYEFYLSDSAQVLVEEARIEGANEYRINSRLERGKSYKWVIVAILPDGTRKTAPPYYLEPGRIPRQDPLNRETEANRRVRCLR